MIRRLERILGAEHGRTLRRYLALLVVSCIAHGLAVATLVPVVSAITTGRLDDAWSWLRVMAILVLAASLLHYLQALSGFRVAITILETLQLRIIDHVATLPLGWFATERVGQLSRLTTSGTINLGNLPAHLLTPLITGIVTPLTIVVCLFFADWRIGLAALVCVPLLAFAMRHASRLIGEGNRAVDRASEVVADRVVEFALAQRVLRAFGGVGSEYEPLEAALTEHGTARRQTMRTIIPGTVMVGLSVQFAFSVLIVTGVALALAGGIEAGVLIGSLVLAARFTGPVADVGELLGAVRMAHNDLVQISDLLDEPPLDEPETDVAKPVDGSVEFDDVSFAYPGGPVVLDSISLQVEAGRMIALVGASGAGKSTLVSLIPRYADATGGTLRIGGVDVRELTSDTVMGMIAMVFQDVYLFEGTLEDNVRLGRPDASDDDMIEAARLSGVDEIVERLPQGWNTVVGEGGMALSGGERQRVSIARALLKRAPIVLVDEGTAALDSHSEHIVRAALASLRGTSTVIVIAHRLDTIRAADEIFVLGDAGVRDGGASGKDPRRGGSAVIERGDHDTLLAAGGQYASMIAELASSRGWSIGEAQAGAPSPTDRSAQWGSGSTPS